MFGKLFGPPCTISIELSNPSGRTVSAAAVGAAEAKTREAKDKNKDAKDTETASSDLFPVMGPADSVSGKIVIKPSSNKKIEHTGIKVELIGQIVATTERTDKYDFISLVKELEDAGDIKQESTYTFDFLSVEKPHDSYNGINARLRYFVRVTISRNYSSNLVQEADFWVQHAAAVAPEINPPIKMEVGIEDALHIEFEFARSKYHLQDIVLGKVYFILVRLPIKHMELGIIRRETTGSGPGAYTETETITRFEIMDGAPVKGESVPIRLFLTAYNLTPTYKNVNNKFTVRYFLNLVLVDEDDKRYFKQSEITLWRKQTPTGTQ